MPHQSQNFQPPLENSAEPTVPLDRSGSWRNQQVSDRYQPGGLELAAATEAPARVVLGKTRRLLGIVLGLCALLLGLSGAGAYWAQQNLVSETGFAQLSQNLADDQEFQTALSEAITQDLMDTSTIANILGNGDEEGLLGGVQNWAHGQLESIISEASSQVIESDTYRELWEQIMKDSHTYNLETADNAAGLDVTAIYREIDSTVGTIFGYDPDLVGQERHIIELDSQDHSIHRIFTGAQTFSNSWLYLLLGAGISALLAVLIWPRHRFYFGAVLALAATSSVWLVTTLKAPIKDALSGLPTNNNLAKVFLEKVSEETIGSLTAFGQSLLLPLLGVALLLFCIGLALQVSKLTARGATARTRN